MQLKFVRKPGLPKTTSRHLALLLIGAACLTAGITLVADAPESLSAVSSSWRADHHMHLGSVDICKRLGDCVESHNPPAVLASDAVRALDAAHIGRGVAISSAYLYGLNFLQLDATAIAELTRRENAFTAAQVSTAPERLVGILSVDPLQDSAVDELRYWQGSDKFVGLKLHFAASAVDIRSENHQRRVARVLEVSAAQSWPVIIHIGGGNVGLTEVGEFIDSVLPSAGASWIQIAHAGGGFPVDEQNRVDVLRAFADRMDANHPATRSVLFDLSYVPAKEEDDALVTSLVEQMRRIGMERFLFGSDFNVLEPLDQIAALERLGLTADERAILRESCAPWVCPDSR